MKIVFRGYAIKRKRKAMHISQCELARLMRTDRKNIYLWEKSLTAPNFEQVAKLLQILDLEFGEICIYK